MDKHKQGEKLHQGATPLCRTLSLYEEEQRVRLSMPGHKGGRADTRLPQAWGTSFWQWDVTELAMTDQLYHAQGCLREAQQLLADFLGAREAYFLVNGASAGLMAGILSVIRPGERILVPRNAHGSIWRGVALAQGEAVVLPVAFDTTWQIPLGMDMDSLEEVFREYGVRAMVAVYPSYHGLYGDMARLVELCRRYDVRLVVDMAHGSHLPYLPGSIDNPIALGADIVVQGWHKTMGSLTQTAVAAVQRDGLPLGKNLLYFQSTSPSYPLLASLDSTRRLWAEQGESLGRALADWAEEFTAAITSVKGWRALNGADFSGTVLGKDCTRVLLVNEAGISGFAVGAALSELGIDVEMSENRLVTIILAVGDLPQKEFIKSRMIAALQTISANHGELPLAGNGISAYLPEQPVMVLPSFAPWSRVTVFVSLQEAVGRVAAEMISLYPPGVPLILAGQVITEREIALLTEIILAGGSVQGVDDGRVAVLVEK